MPAGHLGAWEALGGILAHLIHGDSQVSYFITIATFYR